MHQKKEKIFLQKMSPHLSQLNVGMAHRNYFRRNNLQILKLATLTQIEDHYILGANWQLFRLEKIAKMFILVFYCVYPKHQVLLICNENKEISVANLMIQYRFLSFWE